MSHSPAASLSNSSESVPKKRKTTVAGDLSMAASSQQPHIPKRGARACTACRKGKNRCEGEVRPVFLARYFHLQRPVNTVAGPALGSLSSMPTKRYCLHFRKTRKEECTRTVHSKYRVCPLHVLYHPLYLSSFSHRRLSRLEGQYLVTATLLDSLLSPYFFVVSGHAKPDDWHAILSRQNSIGSPNSKW